MRTKSTFFLFAIIVFFIPLQNLGAASGKWRDNTHLLPQYCKDRAERNDRWFRKWEKTFGAAGGHMHHYCDGLFAERKARTSNRREREHWLRLAVHQMRYVSGPCQKGCPLYPELHSRLGWALGKQGKYGEAIKHYRLAIKENPKYTQAYRGLSDLYININQTDEARKVLEAGLKAKPKSRSLQRRLRKLQTSG